MSASRLLSRESVLRKLKERERYRKREQTVLAQLHDVFEEGEGFEFLGDPMWWRHLEDIDCDRIYNVNSIEFKQLRQMFFEVVFHILLLVVLSSGYALDVRSDNSYRARTEQVNFWQGCNDTAPVTPKEYRKKQTKLCEIETVVDINSFWTWLDLKFIPRAMTPQPEAGYTGGIATLTKAFDDNGFSIDTSPKRVGDPVRPSNVFLGVIRMRQLRVQKNQGCTVSSLFSHIFTDCRSLFRDEYQSTGEYAADDAPTYTARNYRYRTPEETGGSEISGEFSQYPAGGYIADLPLYETEAHTLVHDLWNYGWLDSRSRAVILEFSLLNTNVNVIQNNQILFEFAPTGNVKLKHIVNAWPVWHLEFTLAGTAAAVFFQTVILCGLILYQIYSIFWFIKANGVKYFFYLWNYIDLLIVVIWLIHLVFRFTAVSNVSNEVNLAPTRVGHPELFMPFARAVQSPLKLSRTYLAFMVLLVWLKTLKYMAIFKGFRTIIRVMERALVQLFSFSVVILVIFFSFAVGFYVAFGSTDERFSSLMGSFLILFFYLIGGFELELSDWFLPGSDLMRPLVFFCYLLLTYFILVNIFMAIVLDAFTLVVVIRKAETTIRKKTNAAEDERNPMMTFLYTYVLYLRKIDLIGEEEEKAEDKDYQFIDLEDLPGIVSKKWLEKKRRMIETVARVNGEEIPKTETYHEEKENEDDDYLDEEHYDEDGNLILPNDEIEELPSATQSLVASFQKLKNNVSNYLKPASQKALQSVKEIPLTTKPNLTTKGLYSDDPYALAGVLGRPQLQRLLNEDKALRVLLGTSNALEVIKQFKFIPDEADQEAALAALEKAENDDNFSNDEDLENSSLSSNNRWEPENDNAAISSLQELIFSRLDKLEKGCLNVDQVEVPQIKFLSAQLADLLSDVQNCWREGIIAVLEAATGISSSLLHFTKGIEDVSLNHNSIMDALCVDESSVDDDSGSNSGSRRDSKGSLF